MVQLKRNLLSVALASATLMLATNAFAQSADQAATDAEKKDKEAKTLTIGVLRSSAQGVSGDDVAVSVKVKPKGKGSFAIGLNGGNAIPESGSPLPVPRTPPVKADVQ